jgi:subtilisin family serine protease
VSQADNLMPLNVLILTGVLACSDGGTGPGGGPPPGDRLEGASGALASTAIPRLAYEPRLEDYSNDHQELAGLRASRRVLNLVLGPQVTVGEANALLETLGADIVGGIPGTSSLSGILALRLPTDTHAAMEDALRGLRQDARVAHAVQERLVDPLVVPDADPTLPSWSWDLEPAGGNWGLEISRVPQLWSLNAAVRKAGAMTLVTGVLDAGFAAQHPDLVFQNSPPAGNNPGHGTHVAGIIGARFGNGNGTGVDGVNPFAQLVAAFDQTVVWDLYEFLIAHPEMTVMNISMVGAWAAGTDLNTDVAAQQLANEGGATLRQALALVEAQLGSLPVIVTAASNESNTAEGLQPAAYASEFNNAGLVQGAANIIVVEALDLDAGVATRRPTSNVGGHVSAPGGDILSTIPNNTYGLKGGTSMAAPHVAGLAGYLYALDPSLPRASLSSNAVRAVIVATAIPAAGGASDRMDAFAAAMALDSLHGDDRVLRLLADLDDGTADGNTRVNADGSVNTSEDADGDGGQGDGVIDMSDFRRWRDAFLDLDQPPGYVLDGAPTHPKRDLNGNGRTAAEGDDEFIYPRLDLNGDRKVALAQRAYVGGAIRAQVTDLEVLMARFADEDYQASQLSELILSGDAHVDASVCLARPEVAGVRSWVEVTGSGVLEGSRSHEVAAPVRVYTMVESTLGWTLHLEGLDGSGQVVGEAEKEIDAKPGSDLHWKPDCVPEVSVTITPETVTIPAAGTQQFTATVTGLSNTAVTWSATGGMIAASGNTATYIAGSATGTFAVTVTSVADPERAATAQINIVPAAPVGVRILSADGRLDTTTQLAYTGITPRCDTDRVAPTAVPVTLMYSATLSCPLQTQVGFDGFTYTAQADGQQSYTVTTTTATLTGDLLSIAIDGSSTANASSGRSYTYAEGSSRMALCFSVPAGANYHWRVTGTLSFTGGSGYASAFLRGPSSNLFSREVTSEPGQPPTMSLNETGLLTGGTYCFGGVQVATADAYGEFGTPTATAEGRYGNIKIEILP